MLQYLVVGNKEDYMEEKKVENKITLEVLKELDKEPSRFFEKLSEYLEEQNQNKRINLDPIKKEEVKNEEEGS